MTNPTPPRSKPTPILLSHAHSQDIITHRNPNEPYSEVEKKRERRAKAYGIIDTNSKSKGIDLEEWLVASLRLNTRHFHRVAYSDFKEGVTLQLKETHGKSFRSYSHSVRTMLNERPELLQTLSENLQRRLRSLHNQLDTPKTANPSVIWIERRGLLKQAFFSVREFFNIASGTSEAKEVAALFRKLVMQASQEKDDGFSYFFLNQRVDYQSWIATSDPQLHATDFTNEYILEAMHLCALGEGNTALAHDLASLYQAELVRPQYTPFDCCSSDWLQLLRSLDEASLLDGSTYQHNLPLLIALKELQNNARLARQLILRMASVRSEKRKVGKASEEQLKREEREARRDASALSDGLQNSINTLRRLAKGTQLEATVSEQIQEMLTNYKKLKARCFEQELSAAD